MAIPDIADALARKRAAELLRTAQRQIRKAQEATSTDASEFYDEIVELREHTDSLIRRLNGEPA